MSAIVPRDIRGTLPPVPTLRITPPYPFSENAAPVALPPLDFAADNPQRRTHCVSKQFGIAPPARRSSERPIAHFADVAVDVPAPGPK